MAREKLRESLKQKGWTEEEINKALNLMDEEEGGDRHKEEKKQMHSKLNVVMYWTALIVAIIGNIMLSIIFIPLMLYLTPGILYFTIAVVALTFGTLFNSLISSIEEIDYKQHIVAGIFIPAVALLNVYVMVNFSNFVSQAYALSKSHSPIIIGIIYVTFFILPYVVDKLRQKITIVKK